MGRIVIGGILMLWGTAATIYGLTQRNEGGAYGGGQIAGVVVAACMGIGGLSLVINGISRVNGRAAGRGRSSGRGGGGWDRDRGRGRHQPEEVSSGIVVLVVGGIGLLVLCSVVGVFVVKNRKKPEEMEQVNTNQTNDDGNRQPADPPRFVPQQPQPQSQPELQFPPPPPEQPFEPFPAQPNPIPAAPALKPGVRQTNPAGGAFANNEYREYREDGALLTGFEIGFGKVFNTVIIAYLRPIWLTAKGEVYGTAYGRSQTPTIIVKAREGYAVGGIVIAGGGALEGFALTFMKIGAKHLDPSDAYTSDWYGEPTRKPRPEGMKAGDGAFVIGLYGKRFNDKGGNNYDDGGAIATIGFVVWVKE